MIIRSATKLENEDLVMPAWTAGIQVSQDASGNIRVGLIPALHAGMTQSRDSTWTTRNTSSLVFSKESAVKSNSDGRAE
jgi:hypothetical protein